MTIQLTHRMREIGAVEERVERRERPLRHRVSSSKASEGQ